MADREQPYDPYIPSGGSQGGAGAQAGGNQRTAAIQAVSLSLLNLSTSFGCGSSAALMPLRRTNSPFSGSERDQQRLDYGEPRQASLHEL